MALRKTTRQSYHEAAADLRYFRLAEGLSEEQLGAIVGVDGSTIRRIEGNEVRPRARTKSLLAGHFGLASGDLWEV